METYFSIDDEKWNEESEEYEVVPLVTRATRDDVNSIVAARFAEAYLLIITEYDAETDERVGPAIRGEEWIYVDLT